MAKYTIEAPNGRSITLEGDAPPTEQELEQIFGEVDQPTPQEPVNPFKVAAKTTGRAFLGQGISEFVPGLESEPTKRGIETANAFGEKFTRNVSSTPNVNVPVIGDVNPRTVSRELVAGALDPRSLAGMFGGPLASAGSRFSSRVATGLERGAALKLSQAQDLATKVLNPTNLKQDINLGRVPISIEEATPKIRKVGNYKELRDLFAKAKQVPMERRAKTYSSTKAPLDTSQLDPAADLLLEQSRNPRVKQSEVRKVRGTIERETNALAGETVEQLTDPNYLQQQKEFYQTKADSLYKKREMGTLTGNESAELQGYEKLAKGYQTKLEKLDPTVASDNREFQGLNEAQELASAQAAKEAVTEKPGAIEGLIGRVPFINRFLPINEAKNIALSIAERGRKLPQRTAKIERLVKSAEFRKNLSRSLRGEGSKSSSLDRIIGNERGSVGPKDRRPDNLAAMQDYVNSLKMRLSNSGLGRDERIELKREIAKHEAVLNKVGKKK